MKIALSAIKWALMAMCLWPSVMLTINGHVGAAAINAFVVYVLFIGVWSAMRFTKAAKESTK